MEIGLLSVLGLGLLIGLRHSLDADHVVAVSTIATRTNNVVKAGLTGMFWGLGHTLTILVMGVIVLFLDLKIPEQLDLYFEYLVAAAIVYLGVKTIVDAKKLGGKESLEHLHRFHIRSFVVGMIHGLAGSAALLLVMVSRIQDTTQGFIFLLIFGLGSVVGMFVVAMVLSIPMKLCKSNIVQRRVLYGVGGFSILFAVVLVAFL
ncbi:hypothetical protein [Bacillus alkalicellulosilyticus]|uniref:hypothetical protein n=1 Tax=Alkalihalobacterium alkalicellulosilyticum TaxID=1912214 RepID=UPI000998A8F2|nr:hypothetical protein [Bacillus alkalicellulosilyticus]